MRILETPDGPLEIVDPLDDQLTRIASYWPMQVLAEFQGPGTFGLVFQEGDLELCGVKIQPVDLPMEFGEKQHVCNILLIAASVKEYIALGHAGVLVPCAYLREKGDASEAGLAFFMGPDPRSAERLPTFPIPFHDDYFGAGATVMWTDFNEIISKASEQHGLPLFKAVDVDIRPRLSLGNLAMPFVIMGSEVFVTTEPRTPDDSLWRILVSTGVTRVVCTPMVTAAM